MKLLISLSLIVAVVLVVDLQQASAKLTEQQHVQFLEGHNSYRRKLAFGQVDDQPSAANMKEMKWNDILAAKAQRHVDQCIWDHDTIRFVDGYNGEIRDNLAYWTWNGDIMQGINMWFEEVSGYKYQDDSCTIFNCLHYTQMVWANTEDLGCAANRCDNIGKNVLLVSCNYGPAGNWVGEKPYKEGSACSKCDSGYSCKEGLCVKSQ